jgi:hypothetical protein
LQNRQIIFPSWPSASERPVAVRSRHLGKYRSSERERRFDYWIARELDLSATTYLGADHFTEDP